MARAAAKRTKRPSQAARPQPKRQNAPKPVEKTLFFSRLRRQTKWVFVVLAVVFAFSFVVAGVGSGSTGFGSVIDALGGLFGTSSGSPSGPSVSDAQKKLAKNPKNAAAQLELAQAYEAQGNDIQAAQAYETYLKLPISQDNRISALTELATIYEARAQAEAVPVNQLQAELQQVEGSAFEPDPSSPFGQVFGATQDPALKAQIDTIQAQLTQYNAILQTTLTQIENTYRRLSAADPTTTDYLLEYGQAAVNAGDTASAIKAFKRFLKLASPDDPSIPQVRKELKQLGA